MEMIIIIIITIFYDLEILLHEKDKKKIKQLKQRLGENEK